MRKIKIVSDSSSDLLMLDDIEFASSPMKIILRKENFLTMKILMLTEWQTFLMNIKKDLKPLAQTQQTG